MREERREPYAVIERECTMHLHEQMSWRHYYYSDRIMARKSLKIIFVSSMIRWIKQRPGQRDLSNNGYPMLVAWIPTLIGMLMHGREPGVFAHFNLTSL